MLGALKTGSVSASMATMSMMEQARQEGWGVPIFDATTEASWNEFMGGDVPGIAALTLADTIQKRPETVQAFVGALVKAQDFISAHDAAAITEAIYDDYLSAFPKSAIENAGRLQADRVPVGQPHHRGRLPAHERHHGRRPPVLERRTQDRAVLALRGHELRQSSTWLMALYLMQKAGVADKVDIRRWATHHAGQDRLGLGQHGHHVDDGAGPPGGWGVPIFDATTEASWNEFMGGDVPALTLADTIQKRPGNGASLRRRAGQGAGFHQRP